MGDEVSGQAGHPAVIASGSGIRVAWREYDGRACTVWTRGSTDGGFSREPSCGLPSSEPEDVRSLPLGQDES
jgi:hypothetical protein